MNVTRLLKNIKIAYFCSEKQGKCATALYLKTLRKKRIYCFFHSLVLNLIANNLARVAFNTECVSGSGSGASSILKKLPESHLESISFSKDLLISEICFQMKPSQHDRLKILKSLLISV